MLLPVQYVDIRWIDVMRLGFEDLREEDGLVSALGVVNMCFMTYLCYYGTWLGAIACPACRQHESSIKESQWSAWYTTHPPPHCLCNFSLYPWSMFYFYVILKLTRQQKSLLDLMIKITKSRSGCLLHKKKKKNWWVCLGSNILLVLHLT